MIFLVPRGSPSLLQQSEIIQSLVEVSKVS